MTRFLTTLIMLLIAFPAYSGAVMSIRELGNVQLYQGFEGSVKKEKIEWIKSDLFQDVMTRAWPVTNSKISIRSDMSGDGYLDEINLRIIWLTGIYRPVTVQHGGEMFLLWPFEKFDEIKVGDVDNDLDADIILPGGYAVMMDYDKNNEARPTLEETLKKADQLIGSGDDLGAFKVAFNLFAGVPYKMGAAGEGKDGRFDRDPEVVTDFGDCVITSEQILAVLASGGSYDGFYNALLNIRYLNGEKIYEKRNHFNEVDWIPNNISIGLIKDIMADILPNAPVASGTISKKNWYAAKDALEGDFSDLTSDEIAERLDELKKAGQNIIDETTAVSYYPFEKMFVVKNGEYELDPVFVRALPRISIFNVVNSGRSFKDKNEAWITDVLVSHMGFLIRDDDDSVNIYHATSATDSALSIVTQEELLSFILRRFVGKSGTSIVGLHLSEPLIGR